MQTGAVAREKLFNMRMGEEEWARLDFLTKHFANNAAGVIRMLVKEKYDALQSTKADTFELEQMHSDVLSELSDGPVDVSDIGIGLNRIGYDAKMLGLGRVLNDLRRHGFITKRGGKYELTAKGRATP